MARIIKKIVVPRGTVPMLSIEMQVTRACIFGALAYRSNSELSELIRKKAIQYVWRHHYKRILVKTNKT